MSFPISISKTSEQLPVDPLLVVTRAAIGLGLGLMAAYVDYAGQIGLGNSAPNRIEVKNIGR